MSHDEAARIREVLSENPQLGEVADLFGVAGSAEGLKILCLLRAMDELSVDALAEALGISVAAVSQRLEKLRAYGLVAPRRDALTLYYRLTEHPFNGVVQEALRRARG